MRICAAVLLAFGLGLASLDGQTSSTQGIEVSELETLPSGATPSGTFYLLSSISNGRPAPPWPGDPYQGARSIYVLNADRSIYLIDDASTQVIYPDKFPAGTFSSGNEGMSAMSMMSEWEMNGMESGESGFGAYSFSTDDLWLEITGKTNSAGHFVIHPPAAESGIGVYDLFKTHSLSAEGTGLNLTNWQWMTRCEPGQTNLVINGLIAPQSYFLLARTNSSDADSLSDAFERLVSHSSTTNSDTDGDQLPDDWEWNHFGAFDRTGADDYDSDGMSDILEYLNGTDPNTIRFLITTTNSYVRAISVFFDVTVSGGSASQMAVLVDNANFEGALWSDCNVAPAVVIPPTQGWHHVWIGLRGRTSNEYWRHTRVKFDTMSPLLCITSPVPSSLISPLIQIQGVSTEALARMSFDLTNAAGLFTNQDILITGQHIDTNDWDFTTNYFQAFDVFLTNGLNNVGITAVDFAGNTTTTNLSFTLDYSSATNPPVFRIGWPHDGTEISGTSFTWDGWVDDPNATVIAETIAADGRTNRFSALVGRDGIFWIENLRLNAGTNSWRLMAINSAGNLTTTNINVVQSSMVLTMDPVPESELWKSKVTVTGTISDPDYAVWVNGVKGTNTGEGQWSAADVPVTEGGTAAFRVIAYRPDEMQPDGTYGNQ